MPDPDLSAGTDQLSSLGRKLLKLDLQNVYTKLVVDGPGNEAARTVLADISSRDLIDGPVVREDEADALLAAFWLRYDWLDQSHTISQGIESSTGSLWHAIMHRREGDFSNSKYWYRKTDDHPAYATLAAKAAEVVNPFPADKSVFRITARGWDPHSFVDLVEAVNNKPSDPRHRLAVRLQEIEWQVLFEHCTRAAGGK